MWKESANVLYDRMKAATFFKIIVAHWLGPELGWLAYLSTLAGLSGL